MGYTPSVLNAAREQLAAAKREQEAAYSARLRNAYEKYPRLREIDIALRSTAAEAALAAFRKSEDPMAAIEKIKQRNLGLQQEREWILESSELGEGYLDEVPVCSRCGGSGYLGAEMCDCLQELCRREQKRQLSVLIGTGKERFANFRLDCYSKTYSPAFGDSPYNIMSGVLEDCRHYANTFDEHASSMLFTGKPGLGKTFLSGCIARTVVDRGFSVVYDTVGSILGEYEAAKFGEKTAEQRAALEKYRVCDLLIADDLGTEMTTQFSLSAIYTIINDRLLADRPTIISTNLRPSDIQERYTPQIASRLLGTYEQVIFCGEDYRTRGKL